MELFVFALMILVLAGCPAIWLRAAARRAEGLPLIAYEPRRPVPWTFLHVVGLTLCHVGLQLLLGSTLARAMEAPASQPLLQQLLGDAAQSQQLRDMAGILLANAAASVLMVALGIALLTMLASADLRDLGLIGRAGDIPLGVAAYLALCAPVVAVQALMQLFFPKKHLIMQALDESPSLPMLVLATVAAVFIAPLVEEFLFRGVLQGWLEAVWPRPRRNGAFELPTLAADDAAALLADDASRMHPEGRATLAELVDRQEALATDAAQHQSAPPSPPLGPVLVSSLVFAAVHGWPDCVALFFFALGLGYLYQRTHRLWPSVVLHMCLNAGTMLLLWTSVLAKG